MSFTLLDDQIVLLTVVGVDDSGNQSPAQLAAPAVWVSSDPTILTVVSDAADTTGASGTVTAVGKLGAATITVTGTAAAGAAVLNETFDITVALSPDVSFVVVPGTPTHK